MSEAALDYSIRMFGMQPELDFICSTFGGEFGFYLVPYSGKQPKLVPIS